MARKRGTGSLFRRQSDGRWIGRLPDGRGGHTHVTGTDPEDVRRRLEEARRKRDRRGSASSPGGERTGELILRYLATVAPVRDRPRTIEGYHQLARDHLIPAIGTIRVAQLEPADAQRVVRRMTAARLSPTTIAHAIALLSVVLRHAMREGLTDRNVASLVVLPRQERRRLPSLTTEQVRAFLDLTRGEELWPVWVLCATTGMRIGEVLGLRWQDVEPDAVHVNGQWRRVRVDARTVDWIHVPPKTGTSRRTVYLPALAREAMAVAKAQAHAPVPVFARRDGVPRDRTVVTKAFADALARHGFPSVRLHSLRHTAAVAMLDATGGDLRAVSATLGHASIAITNDVYGKDAEAARRRARDGMDRAMSPVDEERTGTA